MKVKKALCGLLIISYTLAANTNAGEVVGRNPDQTEGKILGGFTALLIGGAMAGPFGALGAGVIGAWSGGKAQASMGLSGERYQILTENAKVIDRRSPNHRFNIGDKVKIENGRPYPLNTNTSLQQ